MRGGRRQLTSFVARHSTVLAPLLTAAVAPLVGIAVLRAPLFNNLSYRDPWFYSGYAWTLVHHVEIFGWFYYSVRFPVILPIRWSTDLFGPVAGYVILRYLILVATGGILYACLRRFWTVAGACTAVVLLAMSSFYLRMVLWDYTSYVAVPACIAGVALWFMGSTRGRVFWYFVLSGGLLGAAVFANALSGTVVAAMLAVDAIAALRQGAGEIGRLAIRCFSAAAGAVAVFIGGYLGYRAYLGPFSPHDILEPTLSFLRQNNQLAAPLQRPVSEFLRAEPRIYAPVIVSVATVVVLGRRIWQNDLLARLAQFAVAYVLLLWLYRFSVTSSVLETWWAYGMTAVSTAFALPLLLRGLQSHEPASPRRDSLGVLLAAVAGTAIVSLVVRSFNSSAVEVYDDIRNHAPILLGVLSGAAVVIVALRFARPGIPQMLATAAFFGVFAFQSLTPASYIGIGQTGEFSSDGHGEILGYRAAYHLVKLLEHRDRPPTRVLIWTTLIGLPVITWVDLPHQEGAIGNPEAPQFRLNRLSPEELDLVRYPTTRGLLVLSENPADMTSSLSALRAAGVSVAVRRRGTWAEGKLSYELLDLAQPRR
jgi:hypothetical protein